MATTINPTSPIVIPNGGIFVPPPTGIYSFSLDSFQILETRSVHTDTDYAAISLTIFQNGDPNRAFQSVMRSKYVGDFNNGTYPVGLAFNNVQLADTDIAVFAYNITNTASSDTAAIGSTLETGFQKLIASGINAGLNAIPIVGNILSWAGNLITPAVAQWLAKELGGIFPGGCDGVVALGAHTFTGANIKTLLSQNGGTYPISDVNPGTNSSGGCGANSLYHVNCSIR